MTATRGRKAGGNVLENGVCSGESQGIPAKCRSGKGRQTARPFTANAREPAASLARKLGVARSTVQERIARLEREGVMKGYTVRLSEEAATKSFRAVVMISADAKQADRVTLELKKVPEVRALSAVSGAYDMMAVVETDNAARMDTILDRIGKAAGVARTVSSIILSEKFLR